MTLKHTFHRTIFWTHLIIGITAGVIILSLAVSGLLISYEKQLAAWADRGFQVTPPEDATRLPIEALMQKVRASKPDFSPSGITWSTDPTDPVTLSMGREGRFYANPYTGELLGEGDKVWRGFFQAVTSWHRFLAQLPISRDVGKNLTGAGTLVFLALLVSGIYLWWPRHWRMPNLKAILLFNRKLKGRARDWNWHNVFGFWSAFPLLFIVLTGLVMSYGWANNLLYTLTGNEPPPPRAQGGGGQGGGPGGGERREGGMGARPEGGAGQREARPEGAPTGEGRERREGGERNREGRPEGAPGEGRERRGGGERNREGGAGGEGQREARPEGAPPGEGRERREGGERNREGRPEGAPGEGRERRGGGERNREGGASGEGQREARPEGGPGGGGGGRGERPAGPPAKLDGLDKMLVQVQQAVPGWKTMSLRMPNSATAPFTISVDEGNGSQPQKRTGYNLDLAKGEMTKQEGYAEANWGRKLRLLSRTTHTGEILGLFGQTIAALCMVATIMLVWTGFALTWRRFLQFRKKKKMLKEKALKSA